ncbi:S8 family serine peptidase (plasmid) [Peteryoungia desertarenae]|uniref:S8 family serine peptidase n=1 Tax=Peteryoungia desertarenae TaxID=1813451 RepID=A0ABX6QT79_9HYPH|nr:S8 family serine peptidase [Peteryoungia desertarenae]QLF71637.1 S8 family serine peptidase [Peteryoungia desertarenae]
MSANSLHALMLSALLVSTALSPSSVRAEEHFTVKMDAVSQSLVDALSLAHAHGQSSLLASVYENTRITPFRAQAVQSQAMALAPELAEPIRLATAIGVSHGLARIKASGHAFGGIDSAQMRTRPPGADNSVNLANVPEFDSNYGLGLIGAQKALDLGLTGKGVVVGVIDSGIDRTAGGVSHPEFAGRIDPRSTSLFHWFDPNAAVAAQDVSAGFVRPADASEDGEGHGTHVSGIIGAGQNGFGMQGVAPGASILSIQALLSLPASRWLDNANNFTIGATTYNAQFLALCGSDAYLTDVNRCVQADPLGLGTSSAIRYMATQSDVRVINGSFGPIIPDGSMTWNTGDLADEADAVRAALRAGQILTIAAGNDGVYAPVSAENPSGIGLFPFIRPGNAYATNSAGHRIYTGSETADFSDMTASALAAAEAADGIRRGRIIVVVATDSQKVLAEYSNKCGVAANWCLAAPGGTNDESVERPIVSTYTNGTYRALQGTSMAAPHVAGAIAVLVEAFPTYSPAQITNILFETAEDLGATGIDEIYGRGFLRLDRALDSGPAGLDGDSASEFVAAAGSQKGDRQVWTTPVTSNGSLKKTGEGTLVLLGNATFQQGVSVDQGELRVDGRLSGSSVEVGQNAILSGNGTIVSNLLSRGQLSPGQSPGLLTINGDLTLAAGSQTNVEIDGLIAQDGAGGFDRISVIGANRVVALGGTLAPVLRGITGAANNDFTPKLGDSVRFLDVASGRITGSFAGLTQPGSGLAAGTRLDVVYGTGSLLLATTPLSYGNLSAHGISQSAAAVSIGRAIDASRPLAGIRPDDALQPLFSSLYLANADGLAQGLEQASGVIYIDSGQSAVMSVGRFADAIWSHQGELARDESSSLDAARFWSKGGRWDGDHGSFDASSTGVTFGLDLPVDTGWWGGAFRYEETGVRGGRNGQADLATYQAAVFGQTTWAGLELAARAGVSHGRLDVARQIGFVQGSQALLASKDHGWGGFAEASIFRTMELGETQVMPSLSLGYRGFGFDGAQESGTVLPLSTPDDLYEQAHVTAALNLSREFALESGVSLIPSLTMGYRHDIVELTHEAGAEVLGTGFAASGRKMGRDAFVGGLAFEAVTASGLTFSAGYEFDIRKGSDQHKLTGALNFRW